jgi:hypothetical protein
MRRLRVVVRKTDQSPINLLSVVDGISSSNGKPVYIYGPMVRGIVTKDWIGNESPHLISHDGSVIPQLMKIYRRVMFSPLISQGEMRRPSNERRTVKPDAEPQLKLISAMYDDEVGDTDSSQQEEILGYLTKEELEQLPAFAHMSVPNRNLFLDRVREGIDIAPSMADVVAKFSANKMSIYIHIPKNDVSLDEYVDALASTSRSMWANNAFIEDGKVKATQKYPLLDLETRLVRFHVPTSKVDRDQEELARTFKSLGWKIAQD